MRERCTSGSVRGARGNLRPYRDPVNDARACRMLAITKPIKPLVCLGDGFRQNA